MASFQEETNIFLSQIVAILQQMRDDHKAEDQLWFQNLLNCNLKNLEPPEIEAGLLINFTILDNVTAKLLGLDPKLLAKIKVVKDYINQIWTNNGGDTLMLNDYIINEEKAYDLLNKYNIPTKPDNNEPQPASTPMQLTSQEPVSLIELLLKEEIMTD